MQAALQHIARKLITRPSVRGIKASTQVAPTWAFESAPLESLRVPVITLTGEAAGEVELHPEIFGAPVRKDVVHEVVVWQRACRRRGLASSKNRGEVRGTTKKAFPQKGGGRARRGDMRSPVLRGGGVAHGPKPRDFSYTLPKKVRRMGLRCVLSAKLLEGRLTVIEDLNVEVPKTKLLAEQLDALGLHNAIFVDGEEQHEAESFLQASKNIHSIELFSGLHANCYDILRRENLVLTKRAVDHLEHRLMP